MKRIPSDFNALIGIRKPLGITSHDCVAKVRRILGERRVGHAGTLDPDASGVMVIGVGQATRLLTFAAAETKSYAARVHWGSRTTTDDAAGEVCFEAPAPAGVLDEEFAIQSMDLIRAMDSQVPPAFSAIHVDGKRAYDVAREGGSLELESRPIKVHDVVFCGLGTNEDGIPYWDIALTVSKGTYIRSVVRDLGELLGSAAHVGALDRNASGAVTLASCIDLETLAAMPREDLPLLDPAKVVDAAVIVIGDAEIEDLSCGRKLSVARTGDGSARLLAEGSRVLMVYDGLVRGLCERKGPALVPKVVFPQGISGARVDKMGEAR